MCEPIFDLPQIVDIESLKAEKERCKQSTQKTVQISKAVKLKSTYELQTNFKVLPVFDHKDRLRPVLSLHANEYLRCKFNEFVHQHVPPHFKLQLFREGLDVKPVPRRLSLNGAFYGTDNKLAPVPIMDDPRQYSKKKLTKQIIKPKAHRDATKTIKTAACPKVCKC